MAQVEPTTRERLEEFFTARERKAHTGFQESLQEALQLIADGASREVKKLASSEGLLQELGTTLDTKSDQIDLKMQKLHKMLKK